MNIRELIAKQNKICPQKVAISFKGKAITFSEIRDAAFKLANYFLKIGVISNDKIAIFLPNTPKSIFAFLGIFSAGATVVPLDFMLTENEIINFINHSQSKILIAHPKLDLANLQDSCPSLNKIIVCSEDNENSSFFDSILKEEDSNQPNLEHKENDLAALFYTSGSTGHPKGVSLEYRHLDNPSNTINHFLGVFGDDVFLCGGVPFSHIGGLGYILLMVHFASTLVLMERFQPLEFLKNIERHKVTIFCIVPAMYIAILSLKGYGEFDLSSLRYAVVFGAPSSPILLKRFHKLCPQAIALNGWGMTETSAPNSFSPPDESKISSIGYLNFNIEAKIVDQAGNKLNSPSQGELWVKGEAIIREYYKEPGLTKEVLTEDGWLKTGDIVRIDSDLLYYIVGRKKDMIKVAGEIVFSAEVEEKINKYSKVAEVAVIGIADDLRGEVPKAFIVSKEKEPFSEQELKDFLKEHLAHFKIPHYFEFVENLPKNRTGKIDKQKLKIGDLL
ncbi:MAG: AMP-binding protein [Candidatus Susulua stagnicola]|nr:AMP-binding protein [Candidatus Susulua stagnicola]